MSSLSFLLTLLFLAIVVQSVPNIPSAATVPNTNEVYSTNANQNVPYNSTQVMATLISYLYGSLMPALIAQQQQQENNNITTQNSSTQPPTYNPLQYYAVYPSTYQSLPSQMESDGTTVTNERVTRAISLPNEEIKTETPPKQMETLPLDLIKHVIHHSKDNKNHQHYIRENDAYTTNKTREIDASSIELPIVCPKCGSKMKLQITLANNDPIIHNEFCTCNEIINKPKYFCECTTAMPQICSICNKIKKYYSTIPTDTYKPQQQQTTPTIVILRKSTNPSTSFRRNIVAAQSPTTTATIQSNYDENLWMTQQQSPVVEYTSPSTVESSIAKRYAIFPKSNENTFFGGYEQDHPQDLNSIMKAVYEAAATEHVPTCYCWRCRFIRRY